MTRWVRQRIRDQAVTVDDGCFHLTVTQQVSRDLVERVRAMEDHICWWAAAPLDLVFDVGVAETRGDR